MVKDEQVRLLRKKRRQGLTQRTAAAIAGMSERSARKWEKGPLPSEVSAPRNWRTRPDPFADAWERDVVPLLEADAHGVLRATTILAELRERYPGRFHRGQLRTLQRRLRDWRAVSGPRREVFFPQQHPPGREAALDFTWATKLGVRIGGEPLPHLLFLFRLSYSGWTWVRVTFGETYEALVQGLQGALAALGGVPEVVRHDNFTAASHELKRGGGRGLTLRFRAFLKHYGLESRPINRGRSHENGVAEKGNGLVKSALAQALVIRGSQDFASVAEYQAFVDEVVERVFNRPVAERLAAERGRLRPLPTIRAREYTSYFPKVTRCSTVQVGGRIYSVPSRLIGHRVEVRQYADHLELRYRDRLVETMPRLHGRREVRVDYRHIIWSLVRKPGAFARYRYREELYPTLTFREAYDALRLTLGRRADGEYLRILHLAASTVEADVERALMVLMASGRCFDFAAVKRLADPPPVARPWIGLPDTGPELRAG